LAAEALAVASAEEAFRAALAAAVSVVAAPAAVGDELGGLGCRIKLVTLTLTLTLTKSGF